MIRRAIPNLITLGNLLCGILGIITILVPDNSFNFPMHYAAWLLILASVLDFMDGAASRLLGVSSKVGKELDSLADAVTFGVLPGLMVFQWFNLYGEATAYNIHYISFAIPLLSVYRLAKFNVDIRQTDSFIGLPTPANALFFASFWLISFYQPDSFILPLLNNNWVLATLSLVFSLLLVSELPLFSLKFKSLAWRKNSWQYLFLLISVGLIVSFYFTAIPFIILLYLLISVAKNIFER